ncbi:MAG: filamentous hemagglutinin N-terminal domain-containing protein, partial [Azoarcus sp.]|nr:filamentous hemagglutinin N-terminal domain-containing protein [Azoarcus sp.]
MRTHRLFTRCVSFTLSGILFINPLLSTAANLVVDGNAGGNTHTTQAGNGAPIVNINTPSDKGLSHNRFTHYNVGPQGLILNNSGGTSNSSIAGGTIQGNPNLTGGSARVILNEVTSANPSHLNGYTEVAGNQAQVIVANPHGITCDGCGFINTPRATLTTGKPVVEAGELKRYDVEQGQIRFEGQDANLTNVSQFEIITRSTQLNAKLHGDRITSVLGRNDVDAQTLEATPKEGDGSGKPKLALDSSALGGMYANSIRLIGTEAGVGVSVAGELAASGGDIHIDVKGRLTLANAAATRNITLKAPEIELKGNLQAGQKASIQADTLTNTEALAASQILIVADTFINTGSVLTPNDLGLQVTRLDNHGILGTAGVLTLEVGELTNRIEGLLFSGGDMALYVQHFTNYGDILAGQNLLISANEDRELAQRVSNRSGTIQSGGSMRIFAKLIENVRDVLEVVTEKVAARLTYDGCDSPSACSGTNHFENYLLEEIDRTEVTQASAPAWLISGADMTLVGGHIENSSSVIAVGADFLAQADTFANRGVQVGEVNTQRRLGSHKVQHGGMYALRWQAYDFSRLSWADAEAVDAEMNAWGRINDLPGWREGYRRQVSLGDVLAMTPENGEARIDEITKEPYTYEQEGIADRIDGVLKNFASITYRGSTFTPSEDSAQYNGVVQAGGTILIQAEQTAQSVLRPSFQYIDGGSSTQVDLNQHLPPDLAHKLTDPLAIAGLPAGRLFQSAAPDHPWAIEIAPYLSQPGAMGSDYLMALLGLTPDEFQRRLGDGWLEQWLIRQAVLARTGAWLLDGHASEEAQYQALMDNAAEEARALKLTLGIELSAGQIAALTKNIVWLVEREVNGQKVLSPVLYLAQNANRTAPNGALMSAQTVQIAGQALSNAGTIKADNLVALIDGKLENSGLMQSRETLALLAETIHNTRGGIFAGQDVLLQSQGHFINEASLATHEAHNTPEYRTRTDFIDAPARIEAGNALLIQAGGNLINQGGVIQANGDASLEAGQSLILDTTETRQEREARGHKWERSS